MTSTIKAAGFWTLCCALTWSVLSLSAEPDNFSVAVEARQLKARNDFLQITADTENKVAAGLVSIISIRTALSKPLISRFDYAGEIRYQPIRFVGIAARLFHANALPERISETQFQARLFFEVPILRWWSFVGAAGYYWNWTALQSPVFWPIPWGGDFSDENWVVQLGFRFRPKPGLEASLGIANFERMETYRLNNPFIQASVSLQLDAIAPRFELWSRYKVLLGFGRLNEIDFGARLIFPFGRKAPKSKITKN